MPRRASSTVPDMGLKPPTNSNGDGPPQTMDEKRAEAISGILQIVQLGCIAFADFTDAGAIGMHGPALVKEVVDLSASNAKVAKKIDLLIEVGPYAGLISVGLPFIVQILCNHGLLKAEQWANAGVVSPESLEYQMKTTIMQQQMEAMARQKQAEEDLARMREEMVNAANGVNPDSEHDNSDVG